MNPSMTNHRNFLKSIQKHLIKVQLKLWYIISMNFQQILGNVIPMLIYDISQNMLEIYLKIGHNLKVDIWIEAGKSFKIEWSNCISSLLQSLQKNL